VASELEYLAVVGKLNEDNSRHDATQRLSGETATPSLVVIANNNREVGRTP